MSRRNISSRRGDTVKIDFTVTDESGATVDLTGATATLTAKEKLSHADVDAVAQVQATEPATGNGVSWTNAASGLFSVTIASSATAELPNEQTELYWDCQVVTAAGEVYTVAIGRWSVLPEVTFATQP